MNNYIYDNLITPWIKVIDRPILQKKDLWLSVNHRIQKDKKYHVLLGSICLHGTFICDKRYCICQYFSNEDIMDCYDRQFRCILTEIIDQIKT